VSVAAGLPSVHAWPRLGTRTLVDAAGAGLAFVASLALLAHGGIGPGTPTAGDLGPTSALLAAGATLPLAVGRRAPRAVLAGTTAASALLVGLGYVLGFALGPAVALYLLASNRTASATLTARGHGAVIALLLVYLAAAAAGRQHVPSSELLHTSLVWAVAWLAGERTRMRRERLVELEDRALRAERHAELDRRVAVAEERARIARDLHDSAGHAINLIGVRAGAARLWHHRDPDRSLAALAAIEDIARETASEIDAIVGRLRAEDASLEPVGTPPGLGSLATLVAHHTGAGLNVAVDTSGEPRALSRAVDETAYRILQEALTNAARHGAGTAAVHLDFDSDRVELSVESRLRAGHDAQPNGGHGLIGMRERATLLGGELDAGATGGLFRVHARLPDRGRQR
jgi:signal transduction histidine kinase